MGNWSWLPFGSETTESEGVSRDELKLKVEEQRKAVEKARQRLELNIKRIGDSAADNEEGMAQSRIDQSEAQLQAALREFNALRLSVLGTNSKLEEEKRNLLERLEEYTETLHRLDETYDQLIKQPTGMTDAEKEQAVHKAQMVRTQYDHWKSLYEISQEQFAVNRLLATGSQQFGSEERDIPDRMGDDEVATVIEVLLSEAVQEETRQLLAAQPYFDEDEAEQVLSKATGTLCHPDRAETASISDEIELSEGKLADEEITAELTSICIGGDDKQDRTGDDSDPSTSSQDSAN